MSTTSPTPTPSQEEKGKESWVEHASLPGDDEREAKWTDFLRKDVLVKGDVPKKFVQDLQMFDDGVDPDEERRLRRKLDWLIIPSLAVCYAFYYIDKTTLSFAALFGIREDLNLGKTEYSWLGSVFYFGWLVWAVPTNLIMQRFPVGKYLGFNIMMWGILLMCQAAAKNFTQLVVLRVLGGAFESTADPAFMFITAMFYSRPEQPVRIGWWYSANGLGIGFGGLLGYAIGQINGALASWKYEFLIIGALCLAWGIYIFISLPDSPIFTFWLDRRERLMAVARLKDNHTGVENKHFKWDQVVEALLDLKTYLFFAMGLVANVPNGGLSNFSTLIIQGLGFNTLQTSLLEIPRGAWVSFCILSGVYINAKMPKNSRTLVMTAYMIPNVVGTICLLTVPDERRIGRLVAYYLLGSYNATFVLGLSLITSNVAGDTKKRICNAAVFLGMCTGNIIGPFFYRTQDAPKYRLGIASILTCNALEIVIILMLRFIFLSENRRRDRQQAAADEEDHEAAAALEDITDKQNPRFRYVA